MLYSIEKKNKKVRQNQTLINKLKSPTSININYKKKNYLSVFLDYIIKRKPLRLN